MSVMSLLHVLQTLKCQTARSATSLASCVYTQFIFLYLGSPFKVPVKDVVDSTKVKVSGPGVASGVRANIPQSFTVDCRKAGVAPLAVAVAAPKGIAEPAEVTDNGDGTHTVSYTPSVEGPYSVAVKYAEEDVPHRYTAVAVQQQKELGNFVKMYTFDLFWFVLIELLTPQMMDLS